MQYPMILNGFPAIRNGLPLVGDVDCPCCCGLDARFTAELKGSFPSFYYQFTDTSTTPCPTGLKTWEWDFGDGSPKSNDQNPIHTYPTDQSGPWTVTLKVTDHCDCTDTATMVVYRFVDCPTALNWGSTHIKSWTIKVVSTTTPCCPDLDGFTITTNASPIPDPQFGGWGWFTPHFSMAGFCNGPLEAQASVVLRCGNLGTGANELWVQVDLPRFTQQGPFFCCGMQYYERLGIGPTIPLNVFTSPITVDYIKFGNCVTSTSKFIITANL